MKKCAYLLLLTAISFQCLGQLAVTEPKDPGILIRDLGNQCELIRAANGEPEQEILAINQATTIFQHLKDQLNRMKLAGDMLPYDYATWLATAIRRYLDCIQNVTVDDPYKHLLKLLENFLEVAQATELEVEILRDLGARYEDMGYLDHAAYYFQQAISAVEFMHHPDPKVQVLHLRTHAELAKTYQRMGQTEEAFMAWLSYWTEVPNYASHLWDLASDFQSYQDLALGLGLSIPNQSQLAQIVGQQASRRSQSWAQQMPDPNMAREYDRVMDLVIEDNLERLATNR